MSEHGEYMIEFFNKVGVDATVLGNHEFDINDNSGNMEMLKAELSKAN